MSSSSGPKRHKSSSAELNRLLSKVNDISLPTDAEFHTLLELGMIQDGNDLEQVKVVFNSLVSQIDETLVPILARNCLQDLRLESITTNLLKSDDNSRTLAWVTEFALDPLYSKLETLLSDSKL
eukprot:g9213.t1